jgi:hypothetical protein
MLGRTVTYGTDRSSETRLSKFTRFCPQPPDTPTLGPHSWRRNRGMVMRYLDETDDVPTRIVKVIGDMCGILTYTVMVLYAVMH